MSGAEVYLKLENLQRGGSFKVRGATYKIRSILKQLGPEGVVAASAGNHAQGVALAARDAGVKATIVMPEWVSLAKQEATRRYGAEVILKGRTLEESIHIAQDLAREGMTFLHPYDDPAIIAGQGTIGLEIFQELEPDYIFVPVGGGGLISGIAVASKALRPETRIVGVQSAACPSAHAALKEGHAISVKAEKSLAEAISVTRVGDLTLPILRDKVDEVVLVEEEEIAQAILLLLERKKVLAEGAGAVPLAALLSSRVQIPEKSKVVLVISGGNVDSLLLDRVLSQGLLLKGRFMRLSVLLEDVPGSLAKLLTIVAGLGANVHHIHHVRSERNLPITFSRVELELETKGFEHIIEIEKALKASGFEINLN
jgi:threonine dehydratase